MTKVQLLTETDKPIYEVIEVNKALSPELVAKGWIYLRLNDEDRSWFGGLNRRDFRVIHD